MATMVVQLGLATMPLGMERNAPALASGTTSGTSGSMRQAEELSMTVAPAATSRGARRATRRPERSTGRGRCRRGRPSRHPPRRLHRRPTGGSSRRSGPRRDTAWTPPGNGARPGWRAEPHPPAQSLQRWRSAPANCTGRPGGRRPGDQTSSGRRPSSARPSVSSSAYSRSPPTGSPLASRETTTPAG